MKFLLITLFLVTAHAKPGIVDGGGYVLRSRAYHTQEMAMTATPPTAAETLSKVTLQSFDNSPSQKWGVAFYGSSTASLTPGANTENVITVYIPPGSSRTQSRQYDFVSGDANESFKVFCSQGGCLGVVESNTTYNVELMDCSQNGPELYWVFERNG